MSAVGSKTATDVIVEMGSKYAPEDYVQVEDQLLDDRWTRLMLNPEEDVSNLLKLVMVLHFLCDSGNTNNDFVMIFEPIKPKCN